MKNKWPLDSMSVFGCHRGITITGLQFSLFPYLARAKYGIINSIQTLSWLHPHSICIVSLSARIYDWADINGTESGKTT